MGISSLQSLRVRERGAVLLTLLALLFLFLGLGAYLWQSVAALRSEAQVHKEEMERKASIRRRLLLFGEELYHLLIEGNELSDGGWLLASEPYHVRGAVAIRELPEEEFVVVIDGRSKYQERYKIYYRKEGVVGELMLMVSRDGRDGEVKLGDDLDIRYSFSIGEKSYYIDREWGVWRDNVVRGSSKFGSLQNIPDGLPLYYGVKDGYLVLFWLDEEAMQGLHLYRAEFPLGTTYRELRNYSERVPRREFVGGKERYILTRAPNTPFERIELREHRLLDIQARREYLALLTEYRGREWLWLYDYRGGGWLDGREVAFVKSRDKGREKLAICTTSLYPVKEYDYWQVGCRQKGLINFRFIE